MTNELTLESARNWTDDQIRQAIAGGLSGMAEALRSASIAVTVAKERGLDIGRLPPVYEFAEHIANGRLSAKAALRIAGQPFLVTPLLPMPHDLQERLADGEKVKIAIKGNDGRVQSAERSIFEMRGMQLRLAFSDGQITPWEEQGQALHQNPAFAPSAPKIIAARYDRKTGQIVVGRNRLRIEDLHQALAEAGQMIVPIYAKARARKGIDA